MEDCSADVKQAFCKLKEFAASNTEINPCEKFECIWGKIQEACDKGEQTPCDAEKKRRARRALFAAMQLVNPEEGNCPCELKEPCKKIQDHLCANKTTVEAKMASCPKFQCMWGKVEEAMKEQKCNQGEQQGECDKEKVCKLKCALFVAMKLMDEQK